MTGHALRSFHRLLTTLLIAHRRPFAKATGLFAVLAAISPAALLSKRSKANPSSEPRRDSQASPFKEHGYVSEKWGLNRRPQTPTKLVVISKSPSATDPPALLRMSKS